MTVIHNPERGESSAVGIVAGVVVAIAIIALFAFFALPAIRGEQPPKDNSIDVNVKLPGGNNAPQQ